MANAVIIRYDLTLSNPRDFRTTDICQSPRQHPKLQLPPNPPSISQESSIDMGWVMIKSPEAHSFHQIQLQKLSQCHQAYPSHTVSVPEPIPIYHLITPSPPSNLPRNSPKPQPYPRHPPTASCRSPNPSRISRRQMSNRHLGRSHSKTSQTPPNSSNIPAGRRTLSNV